MATPDTIYAEQMFSQGFGFPLWNADPLEQYPVILPGDIGELESGKFYPAWNMFEPTGQAPPTRKSILSAPRPLRSQTVSEIFLESAPTTKVGYRCADRGALLSLKDGSAVVEDLTRAAERALLTYAVNNMDEVLALCNLVDATDLVFITGTTTAGDWDAIVFNTDAGNSHPSDFARFPVELRSPGNETLEILHMVNQTISHSGGHCHSDAKATTSGPCCSSDVRNQCVFVRTMRIRRRPAPLTGGSFTKSSSSVNQILYDELFSFLFLQSDASTAFIYDRDVLHWLEGGKRTDQSFSVSVEAGVAHLEHKHSTPESESTISLPPLASSPILHVHAMPSGSRPQRGRETSRRGQGRKVTHASKACGGCQRRKARCGFMSGSTACTECITRGEECSFADDFRGPSWNRKTMESYRELEKNLVAENRALSSQVEALKNFIQQSGASSSLAIPEDDTDLDNLEGLTELTRRHLVLKDEVTALHGIWSPWVYSAPSKPATSPGQSQEPSTMDANLNDDNFDFIDHRALIYSSDLWHRDLPEGAFLDQSEHSRICDCFFRYVASWGYRVVESLFWRDMYLSMLPGSGESAQRTSHYSPFLHNALLSVATAFSDDPDVREITNRKRFANKAKGSIETECSKPAISTVSGLSCLATFHSGRNEHGLGFMYFGISVRMSRSLGLNVDCHEWVKAGKISTTEQRNRAWGFWITYAQDVWWSLYVGREFSINISHVTISLPKKEALPVDKDKPTWEGSEPQPRLITESFVESCRLSVIATKIMDVVYGFDRRGSRNASLLNQIDKELSEWYSSLPQSLAIKSTTPPQVLMLHLAYHWCIILLHSPFYKHEPNPKSSARTHCLRAVRVIMETLEKWRKMFGLRFIPITIMTVIFAAGTLSLFTASEPQRKASTRQKCIRCAENCVVYLRECGQTWESGTKLSEMLGLLIDSHTLSSGGRTRFRVAERTDEHSVVESEDNQLREVTDNVTSASTDHVSGLDEGNDLDSFMRSSFIGGLLPSDFGVLRGDVLQVDDIFDFQAQLQHHDVVQPTLDVFDEIDMNLFTDYTFL